MTPWLVIQQGERLSTIEKRVILWTLDRLSGNRTRTADSLGISIRTLRNKLSEYGIPPLGPEGHSALPRSAL